MSSSFPIVVSCGLLVAAAWTVAWVASRWVDHCAERTGPGSLGLDERVDRLQCIVGLSMLLVVGQVALLGIVGWLRLPAVVAVLALLALSTRWARRAPSGEPEDAPEPERLAAPAVWALAATSGLLVLDLLAYLPAPPVDWDAMTYHLYLPARWLDVGRLAHVPTVFSDNAAAYAPQNGALLFTWLLALAGRDELVQVIQLPVLALLGLAVFRLARSAGVGRTSAVLAASTLPWLRPVREATYSALVDLLMTAAAVAALSWVLDVLRAPKMRPLLAASLAAGLAAGTKFLGLPLAALVLLPAGVASAWRRRWWDLAWIGLAATAGGGWWYASNLCRYGNPLFPLDLTLGPLYFPGAYDQAAVRAGEFHLPAAVRVLENLVVHYGAVTSAFLALSLLVLCLAAVRDLRVETGGARRLATLVVGSVAVIWLAYFVWWVPHNNQTRFLLPTVALALVGWARVLDWAGVHRLPRLALWAVAAGVLSFDAKPWRAATRCFDLLREAGTSPWLWALFGSVLGTLLGTLLIALGSLALRRGGRLPPAATTAVVTWAFLALGLDAAEGTRPGFYADADYGVLAPVYLPFQTEDWPPLRIAYAGMNVPYTLVGPALRNTVIYVDTQGEQGDGFYEHWRRDPKQYEYHKPGLYRGHDDAATWLRNLAEVDPDLVVAFEVGSVERRYLWTTPTGFPLERVWMDQRPDRFELLAEVPHAAIYRVVRADDADRLRSGLPQ